MVNTNTTKCTLVASENSPPHVSHLRCLFPELVWCCLRLGFHLCCLVAWDDFAEGEEGDDDDDELHLAPPIAKLPSNKRHNQEEFRISLIIYEC